MWFKAGMLSRIVFFFDSVVLSSIHGPGITVYSRTFNFAQRLASFAHRHPTQDLYLYLGILTRLYAGSITHR